ncbi:MAG: YfhO family protein [Oscillospiraceae bacterium]|nr:YfhO family protein [Oscillospiraceae bacterium]
MPGTAPKARPARVFLTALAVAAVIFLPFVIYNKGIFLYYGDFNVQQIPFYMHVHDAILSGGFGWDPVTDLGVDLLTSYSFYCSTSPFFWLTLPFPSAAIPYLMAPLLVLKTACAALTSYYYILRFVREEFYARMGALLYAFSGFVTYNIFFNHFHEAIVFFPLMLVALEELLTNKRRGFFALAVALNAVVNYWFFIGEVVFVVVYFFVRTLCDREHCPFGWGKLAHTAFEGALGVALAAFVFLPSVLTVMGNPRTTPDTIINGWNLWYYYNPQRYLALVYSLFFPPEMPSLPNFFTDHGAKWASLSAYLPMMGLGGVLVFFRRRGKFWLRRMLAVCAVLAAVPVFNAAFVLFNNSYYARWFYMPILLMCAASACSMEEAQPADWNKPLTICLGAVAAIAVMTGLTPDRVDDRWVVGMADHGLKMWIVVALALLGLVLSGLLFLRLREHENFKTFLSLGLCAFAVAYTVASMSSAVATFHNNGWITGEALPGRGSITLPEEDGTFSRVDIYEGNENLGLFWELPSIQAFQSVVPVSIMEFYPEVGVKRDVSSKPETDHYTLRPLLSVRWLLVDEEEENQSPMPGYTYRDNQYGYNIYENDCYLPMGFAYDRYISREQWESLTPDERSGVLLRGVYLEETATDSNSDLLAPLSDELLYDTSEEQYYLDVQQRREMAAEGCVFEDGGFTCQTDFDRTRLVFFSIPYSEGWSAWVDDMPAEILQANVGFMAIRVPEGERTVRLDYQTPGLGAGLAVSVTGIFVLAVWMTLGGRLQALVPARKPKTTPHQPLEEEADHESE